MEKKYTEHNIIPSKKRQNTNKKDDLIREEPDELNEEQSLKMKKKEHAAKHEYKGEGVIHDVVQKASKLVSAPVKKAKKILKKTYST